LNLDHASTTEREPYGGSFGRYRCCLFSFVAVSKLRELSEGDAQKSRISQCNRADAASPMLQVG
jgi:hypothetical protein